MPAHPDKPVFADPKREVPDELREAPFAAALEAARRVNFSEWEWTEYEREKMAQQAYTAGLTHARKEGYHEGRAEGHIEGHARGLRAAVLDLCEVLGIALDPDQRARLDQLDPAALEALRAEIKSTRTWPAG